MCHILISYIVVATRVAHKVQLHLDLYVCMNMYIKTIYTCCIRRVTCNCMSCATCLMQLHKFVVGMCRMQLNFSCKRQLQNLEFLVVNVFHCNRHFLTVLQLTPFESISKSMGFNNLSCNTHKRKKLPIFSKTRFILHTHYLMFVQFCFSTWYVRTTSTCKQNMCMFIYLWDCKNNLIQFWKLEKFVNNLLIQTCAHHGFSTQINILTKATFWRFDSCNLILACIFAYMIYFHDFAYESIYNFSIIHTYVGHKHVKVHQLVILAQKVKIVSGKYILNFWILGLLLVL
jgi:hypothetical protein